SQAGDVNDADGVQDLAGQIDGLAVRRNARPVRRLSFAGGENRQPEVECGDDLFRLRVDHGDAVEPSQCEVNPAAIGRDDQDTGKPVYRNLANDLLGRVIHDRYVVITLAGHKNALAIRGRNGNVRIAADHDRADDAVTLRVNNGHCGLAVVGHVYGATIPAQTQLVGMGSYRDTGDDTVRRSVNHRNVVIGFVGDVHPCSVRAYSDPVRVLASAHVGKFAVARGVNHRDKVSIEIRDIHPVRRANLLCPGGRCEYNHRDQNGPQPKPCHNILLPSHSMPGATWPGAYSRGWAGYRVGADGGGSTLPGGLRPGSHAEASG